MSVPKMGLGSSPKTARPQVQDGAQKAPKLATLTALRDALAKATGPDRELDVAFAQTIWPQFTQYNTYCVGDDEPLFFADPFYKQPCPRFTTSIDAAVTLVPPDTNWVLAVHSDEGIAATFAGPAAEVGEFAATPALALCLARIEYEIAILAEKGE